MTQALVDAHAVAMTASRIARWLANVSFRRLAVTLSACALIDITAFRIDTGWITHRNAAVSVHPEARTTPAMIRRHTFPLRAVHQLWIAHWNALKPVRFRQLVPLQAMASISPGTEPITAFKITLCRTHRIIPHSKLQQLFVEIKSFPTFALIPLITNPINAIIRTLRNANPGRILHEPNPANALIRCHTVPIPASTDATRNAPSTHHHVPSITGANFRRRTATILATLATHRNTVRPVPVVTVAAGLLLAYGVIQKAAALRDHHSIGARSTIPAATQRVLNVRKARNWDFFILPAQLGEG